MPDARPVCIERNRARTYITVIQAPEGYPSDSELRTVEESPAPPVLHAVVLLDDHEKLEAEVEELREALERIKRLWTDPAPAQRQDVAYQEAVRIATTALGQRKP